MPSTQMKQKRIYLRLDTSTKKKIKTAAALSRKSITDFVVSSAIQAADEAIEQNEKMVLSERDRNIFFKTLINPPPPNKALREAIRKYRQAKSH
jgi:uncharacterized protein (DUF1778 family)